MIDAAHQQLMKHAHRLAMDGHGDLAQYLRDAIEEATAPRKLLRCHKCQQADVSMEVTCHNSRCNEYAKANTVYEGWKIHD
jgi:hypothetical protein